MVQALRQGQSRAEHRGARAGSWEGRQDDRSLLEHRRSQSQGGLPPWPVLPDVMALVRELAFCPVGARSGLGMGLLLVGAPKAGHTVGSY